MFNQFKDKFRNQFADGVSSQPAFAPAPAGGSRSNRTAILTVKWGKEKLSVPISTPLHLTKLSALRTILAAKTGLAPSEIKLVHAGGVMLDDQAPLSSYGLRDGSVLAVIGSAGAAGVSRVERERVARAAASGGGGAGGSGGGSKSKKAKADEEATTEPRLVESIRLKVGETQASLGSQVEEFENAALNGPAPVPGSEVYESLLKQHRTLGELLLQLLLWLDGVQCPAAWEEARKERKQGVKSVQGWLDRVDAAWATAKQRAAVLRSN